MTACYTGRTRDLQQLALACWPAICSANGVNPVSQLLHPAINIVKFVDNPKILIHLANDGDWSNFQWWLIDFFIRSRRIGGDDTDYESAVSCMWL